MRKRIDDPLERVIRPIVEGQIRGFLKEHPPIVDAVDWYKPRKDKALTFTNSLSKRIVRDLSCPVVRARLAAALVECSAASPPYLDCGTPNCGERSLSGTATGQAVAARRRWFWPFSTSTSPSSQTTGAE